MVKIIAETAWHHEGDLVFMKELVSEICLKTRTNYIKLHINVDFDEYMSEDHPLYNTLKEWVFNEDQWLEVISIIRKSGKELMLLLNDNKSVDFASKVKPEIVEIHAACLNVPSISESILKKIDRQTKIILGVGGSTSEEIESAIETFKERDLVLMFGFQNYPTKFESINLKKIRALQKKYSDLEFGYADHTSWDNENNKLVTMMVASNRMSFIEKHVTLNPGVKRTDFSAAISIDLFNRIHDDIEILEKINGTGELFLNEAEKDYSKYGPNKLAAICNKKLKKGESISLDDITFTRTKLLTDLSQLDMIEICKSKKVLDKDINEKEVFSSDHFTK